MDEIQGARPEESAPYPTLESESKPNDFVRCDGSTKGGQMSDRTSLTVSTLCHVRICICCMKIELSGSADTVPLSDVAE